MGPTHSPLLRGTQGGSQPARGAAVQEGPKRDLQGLHKWLVRASWRPGDWPILSCQRKAGPCPSLWVLAQHTSPSQLPGKPLKAPEVTQRDFYTRGPRSGWDQIRQAQADRQLGPGVTVVVGVVAELFLVRTPCRMVGGARAPDDAPERSLVKRTQGAHVPELCQSAGRPWAGRRTDIWARAFGGTARQREQPQRAVSEHLCGYTMGAKAGSRRSEAQAGKDPFLRSARTCRTPLGIQQWAKLMWTMPLRSQGEHRL